MHILSYRGPGNAGGVSGALMQVMRAFAYHNQQARESEALRWWFMSDNRFCNKQSADSRMDVLCNIPEEVIEGHYRYCNNFIWPILHDLTKQAHYSSADRELYRRFNLAIAFNLIRARGRRNPEHYFIQDYQMALVPEVMKSSSGEKITVFWHTPWPKTVDDAHLEAIKEIAWGLLDADLLGFHTEEYAANFLNFVEHNFPAANIVLESKRIRSLRSDVQSKSFRRYSDTEIVAQPLGLDLSFWNKLHSPLAPDPDFQNQIRSTPFILSVDRADYTKGILQRVQAVDYLFSHHPELIGKYSFVQVCQQSRLGLSAFDEYWRRCQVEAEEVNRRWRIEGWQPLVWRSEALSAAGLKQLYETATAMLVNPLRDGLNLTAKEFVACSPIDSVLILSEGAGVWQEFNSSAMTVSPESPELMASQILEALSLPVSEKIQRMHSLKEKMKQNTLHDWWHCFTGGIHLAQDIPVLHQNRTQREKNQRAVAPYAR